MSIVEVEVGGERDAALKKTKNLPETQDIIKVEGVNDDKGYEV